MGLGKKLSPIPPEEKTEQNINLSAFFKPLVARDKTGDSDNLKKQG